MKKFLRVAVALLVTLTMLLALVACGGAGTQKDKYGHKRPQDSWISECLILPSMPSLEDLFGTGGQSGLLGEYALNNNGKLSDEGTNYLVVLCYGTPRVETLKSYLRFVLVGEDGLLFDEECVDVGSPLHYGISVGGLDMTATPNARLQISTTGSTMQGAVVIPFTVKAGMQGNLYAYCSLEGNESISHYYVDGLAEATVGAATGGKEVSVDQVTVGYLSQQAYNEGSFDDAAISTTPSFEDGLCYMVLDLAFTAKKSNDGELSLNCFICIQDETGNSVTLEEAPTGKVEKKTENNMLRFDASYGVPVAEGEQKSVRMVLRINEERVLDSGIEVFLCGSSGVTLSGTVHVSDALEWDNQTVLETPKEEKKVPVWGIIVISVVAGLMLIGMCSSLSDEIVPTRFTEYLIIFLTFALPAAAFFMMFAFTTWSWWVISLVGFAAMMLVGGVGFAAASVTSEDMILLSPMFFVILPIPLIIFTSWPWWAITIATVVLVVASFIVESMASAMVGSDAGECGPLVLSSLLTVGALIFMIATFSWSWWAIMLADIGVMIGGSIIMGAIGSRM